MAELMRRPAKVGLVLPAWEALPVGTPEELAILDRG